MNIDFQKLIDMSAASRGQSLALSDLRQWVSSSLFDGLTLLRLQGGATTYFASHGHEWQQIYVERGYFRCDPIVAMARRHGRLVAWTLDPSGYGRSAETKAMCKLANSYGLRSGISVPISIGFGRFAIFTLYSDCPVAPDTSGIDTTLLVAAVTHLHHSLPEEQSTVPPPLLKTREVRCLRWAAEGKSMREVARLEGLSYSTVRFFIDRAKEALGAVSLPQATALAKEFDLI